MHANMYFVYVIIMIHIPQKLLETSLLLMPLHLFLSTAVHSLWHRSSAKSSGLQGFGRRGHSSRCSIVWGPQSHSKLAYWLYPTSASSVCIQSCVILAIPHLCIKCLQRQTPVLRQLRHCQAGHGFLESLDRGSSGS